MQKEQIIRIWIMVRLCITRSGWEKAEYLRRKGVFHSMGKKCYWHPTKIPAEPHLVSMGENVFIGTGVTLITHNMVNCVFNNMTECKINGENGIPQVGRIIFGDNVFVGANSTVLYNVKIGNNCIIAANSVVTKDVKDGTVVAGVPAREIGTFDDQYLKYKEFNQDFKEKTSELKGTLWNKHISYFWGGRKQKMSRFERCLTLHSCLR